MDLRDLITHDLVKVFFPAGSVLITACTTAVNVGTKILAATSSASIGGTMITPQEWQQIIDAGVTSIMGNSTIAFGLSAVAMATVNAVVNKNKPLQ